MKKVTNILLVIIAIELFIMLVIDKIRYVYIVDYTFVSLSIIILALIICSIIKRKKKHKQNDSNTCDNACEKE